ncbi:hypothetical protein BDM02DRAFT_57227 [Thelephora ganbajun]|uniref:Uncharacterized protein n=1 Tax=Thelephora ganbajun TaxID=370292 RepID=A0ACB6ZX06_THEGA|nr:hypothetical protein BDM02DRAFT_57227 [Thelephora ganbajun]
MPVTTSKYILQSYSAPSALPPFVWSFFAKHQQHTNVLYPVAKGLLERESDGDVPTDCLWLTCSTSHNSATDPTLDFVLSVTPGPQGSYPVFICTPLPVDQLGPDYILPRMQRVVEALCASVPLERVYSVFAPAPITYAFAEAWTRLTGIKLDADPEYYSAKLTHCTDDTFRSCCPTLPVDRSYIMRPAVPADIPAAAELCHGFAAVSEPFTLSQEGAVQEATYLVQNNMLWVHEITRPGQPTKIASIVAITRSSESVAGITKVFTNPDTRNMGCAERLVRTVCHSLLKSHESVVLYVAHNNPAAFKVYHKVGFQGLESPKAVADGVEDWLELGFDRKRVVLGHW